MLPNLSVLRHAPAPTGPYVDVLGDDQVCALTQQRFGSYTRSGRSFRKNACPKAWQLLIVDPSGGPSRPEANYYDTIELAMWLLDDTNTMSPTRTGQIDEYDRRACIAKARELLPVEKDWRNGLEAYKAFIYPESPPDDDEPMELEELLQYEDENSNPTLGEILIAQEFNFFGDNMLTGMMSTGNDVFSPMIVRALPQLRSATLDGVHPLHYSKLLPLVTPTNFLEERPVGLHSSPVLNSLRGYGIVNDDRLIAIVSAAYAQYKKAFQIMTWSDFTSTQWTRFLGETFDDEEDYHLLSSVAPSTYVGLKEMALQLATEELVSLPSNRRWYTLSANNANKLINEGWEIGSIVANATLTLYVLLNIYWSAPNFGHRDPGGRYGHVANLRNLEGAAEAFVRRVMGNEPSSQILEETEDDYI